MTLGQNVLNDEIQKVLGEIVANGIDVHRCVAATALGQVAHVDAGEVLQKALLDEDEDVRSDVVAALANLADPSTADAIMENFLGDPCPEVKLAAIDALVKLKHHPIVPHLLKLVTSREDDDITWDEDAFYEAEWDDWLDIQFAAITALGKLGIKEAVGPIVEALNDDMGQDVSHLALPALAKLGDAGLKALDDLFEKGGAQMRRRICADIILDNTAYSSTILEKCLADKDTEVRKTAVEKLLAYSQTDPRLEALFADKSAQIRALIIENIGSNYPEKVMAALNDDTPVVRKSAFKVIADNPDRFEREGFSEIVVAAIAGDPEVGGQAAIAWAAMIGEPSASSLGEALENTKQPIPFRLGLIDGLAKLDDAGFQWLAKAAGDEDRQVRIAALEAIADMAEKEKWPGPAGETLLAALNGDLVEAPEEAPADDDEQSDEAAALDTKDASVEEASTDEDSESVVVPFKKADEIEDVAKPVAAISTLEQMMNKGIQTEMLPDDDYVEEEVVLDEQDERYIELSKQRAMRKRKISLDVKVAPHQDVRRYAARLFSNINRPSVIEALAAALEVDDDELKIAVLDTLSCLAGENNALNEVAFERVLNEAGHSNERIRRLAIRCVGWIRTDEANDMLRELLDDENVHIRQEAIRAIGKRPDAREALVAALKDDYSGVRISAARALAANPDENTIAQLVTLSLGYDGMHRRDVVDIAAKLDPQKAGELYLKVLDDDASKRVWRVAIEALGELFAYTPVRNISLAA